MLKLLMIQNRIFAQFIQHLLATRGEFVYELATKLQREKWDVSRGMAGRELLMNNHNKMSIYNKKEIREFTSILRSNNIEYSINRVEYSNNTWDKVVLTIKAGQSIL